jgi:hypothetical protein
MVEPTPKHRGLGRFRPCLSERDKRLILSVIVCRVQ